MTNRSLRELTVGDLLAAVSAPTSAPASGAVAALTTALAIALAGMAARFSVAPGMESSRFVELVARAEQLGRDVDPLADDDVAAYGEFLAALRMAREPDPDARRARISRARSRAVDVPLATAEIAADCAEIAGELAASGNRNLRGDAATAALLCHATATAAAIMISENLGPNTADHRVQRVRSARAAAGEAVQRILVLFPAAGQSAVEMTD